MGRAGIEPATLRWPPTPSAPAPSRRPRPSEAQTRPAGRKRPTARRSEARSRSVDDAEDASLRLGAGRMLQCDRERHHGVLDTVTASLSSTSARSASSYREPTRPRSAAPPRSASRTRPMGAVLDRDANYPTETQCSACSRSRRRGRAQRCVCGQIAPHDYAASR